MRNLRNVSNPSISGIFTSSNTTVGMCSRKSLSLCFSALRNFRSSLPLGKTLISPTDGTFFRACWAKNESSKSSSTSNTLYKVSLSPTSCKYWRFWVCALWPVCLYLIMYTQFGTGWSDWYGKKFLFPGSYFNSIKEDRIKM